jgi:hypothetical protein
MSKRRPEAPPRPQGKHEACMLSLGRLLGAGVDGCIEGWRLGDAANALTLQALVLGSSPSERLRLRQYAPTATETVTA